MPNQSPSGRRLSAIALLATGVLTIVSLLVALNFSMEALLGAAAMAVGLISMGIGFFLEQRSGRGPDPDHTGDD